ncbi:MAG: FMN-binding negative transcriptional regulator [Hyphomonas sp.]|uniref:FMN-binding negative transcriptional regulator n=1 Tax=Hyphomonas sp. TaxID=87 RepID=UPI003527DD11
MHPAHLFHEPDPDILLHRIAAHPFALVTAVRDGRPVAAHTPALAGREGDAVRLRFHLSKANPVTEALVGGAPALLVFTGAHAYVSPDWYGMEDQVPTWNYVSVEAEGVAAPVDDAAARQLLDDLSVAHETPLLPKPVWRLAKMTPAKLDALLRGIVAFDLVPSRFEGITKLSQNKPAAARDGVIDALDATKRDYDVALADEMRRIQKQVQ